MARKTDKPPEFFVDRSLGKSVVEALCEVGLTVYSMADVYGEARAQRLADEVWLRDAGRRDWIVLTKDDAIRRRAGRAGRSHRCRGPGLLPDHGPTARSRADRAVRRQPPPHPSPAPPARPLYLWRLRERPQALVALRSVSGTEYRA